MEWKFMGACLLLMWVGEIDSLEARSNLCRPRRAYTSDCSHQMGISQGACRAIIDRNNTACWAMNFPSWNSPTFNGQHFKLRTYCYNDGAYQRTGLNATINSGSWTEAAFRFTIEGMNFVSCVQFIHNASVHDNFVLFYDCIWHKDDLPGEQMKVDYFLKDQSRDIMEFGGFHFILPECHFNEIGENYLDISRHQTFIYVDETASSSFTKIYIQKMPVDYQISSYSIKKCHTCEANLSKEVVCSKAYCTIEEKVKTVIDDEEIVLQVPSNSNENCYYLAVEAVCHNCSSSNWCVGRSVLLTPSKTGVAVLPFIVGLLCFLTVLTLSCKYHTKKQKIVGGNKDTHPKVLFVYNPVHDVHVQIIKSIVKLMAYYYEIDILFDDIDITKSPEKDPHLWYNNAVLEADYIAIVSALSSLNKNISIYNNLFQVVMVLVEQKIKNNPSGVKIFNISFPYNLKNDVITKTKCWRHFQLMNDFDKMIMYIHKNVKGWRGCKSLPEYLELCKNIENMRNILTQEESDCLNTKEDNFVMISSSERSVSTPAINTAEYIGNIDNDPVEDSRNTLNQEYESSQELLQRNGHSPASSRESIYSSDSSYLMNVLGSMRDSFVISVDKFLDLDGLL